MSRNRAGRLLAWFPLLVYVGGWTLAIGHQATTVHLICPEHGQPLLHVHTGDHHAAAPAAGAATSAPRLAEPRQSDEPLHHAHCLLAVHCATEALGAPWSGSLSVEPAPVRCVPRPIDQLLPRSSVPLLFLAPKQGPPAPVHLG